MCKKILSPNATAPYSQKPFTPSNSGKCGGFGGFVKIGAIKTRRNSAPFQAKGIGLEATSAFVGCIQFSIFSYKFLLDRLAHSFPERDTLGRFQI